MPAQLKAVFLLVLLCSCTTADIPGQQMARPSPCYAQSVLPTPVLNTPEISSVFGTQAAKPRDHYDTGLVRELEFIALPGTVFTIEAVIRRNGETVYRVTTVDYPYPSAGGYYIDSRFVRARVEKPPERAKRLPAENAIIAFLISSEGSPYLWGGNVREGISQMLSFYPPPAALTQEEHSRWMLQGLDCSGLLYQATGGCTPRNTGALVNFGDAVPIADLTLSQIIQAIEPLDIIVWPGHVIIVLDRDRVIESRLAYDAAQAGNQGGVKIRTIGEVLTAILKERIPVDSYDTAGAMGQKQFVIRRWCHHSRNH
jgi:cell wall-associated NlpC family hydrolase